MRSRSSVVRVALMAASGLLAWAQPAAPAPATIIKFHADDFWLNLHHFLYVLGRAEAKFPDSQREGVNVAPADQERGIAHLGAEEQKIWREAVTAYATGLSKSDAVASRDLVTLSGALVEAGDQPDLSSPPIPT